ncbi:MAG TPA: GNAT family N-acetyltransferase [Gammaproteobacteria bacterium]|nr:GNAT family N-acetyltransferase [Gammaproteobacteria bacterium]
MNIQLAKSDPEIEACFPVMKALRQDLLKEEFVSRIRELEKGGYMIASLSVSGEPVAVAGFRLGESLAWGRYLYIDDLVTLPEGRSKGYGSKLLGWLTAFARENRCLTIHLDSGVERKHAHRFYEKEGFLMPAYHFFKSISA